MSDWTPPDHGTGTPSPAIPGYPNVAERPPAASPRGGPAPTYYQPHQPGMMPAPTAVTKTSGLAVTSLVLGLLSWVLPIIGGLMAIGFGVGGLFAVRGSKGRLTGNGLAATGLILGVLSSAVWGSAIASEDFRSDFSEGFSDGFAETQPSRQLSPGDCLNFSLADSTDFQIDASDVVDCSIPHSAEYAGSVFNPASSDASYPGDGAAFEQALDLCLIRFAEYVGTDYQDTPDLDLFVSYPQSFAWNTFNDRESACYITQIDESLMTGSVSQR